MKRVMILTLLIILFLSIFSVLMYIATGEQVEGEILYVDDDGDKKYSSIQEALSNASDGDTIYVFSGIYNGSLWINKSINLIGENKENTILTCLVDMKKINLIVISADNVTISGFTIQNSVTGYWAVHHDITYPTWLSDFGIGIEILSDNTTISGNIIQKNEGYGILLNHTQNTTISKNYIINHIQACIYVKNSSNNKIVSNNIKNNEHGIIFNNLSTNNILYYNNFINNSYYHVYDLSYNTFYDIKSKKGNYWDDYNGFDNNYDNIGDKPYNISGGESQDQYPLMSPYIWETNEFIVNEKTLYFMLIVSMIVGIIFLLPIAYLWYRKKKKMGYY